jgi:Uma2 family endonuclease
MVTSAPSYNITWEKLPDDFVLEDEPVDNIYQPPIAAALTESLENTGRYPATALITTNYGICATLNQQLVIKAPDWSYVPAIQVPREDVQRSYTPRLQGELPAIVMEFLSDTDGSEYSSKPTYPPGKWFFYEQILQVVNYAIFAPATGALEIYRLGDDQRYGLQQPDELGQYWIAEMNLFLGAWRGDRENRTGFWLRWWDEQRNLLLWGTEATEQERQRADRLAAQLRAAGIEPES